MSKKLTHTVTKVGCDSRTPEGFAQTIRVRVTKTTIIDQYNTKFNRITGWMTGSKWPLFKVKVDTLREV